MSASTIFLLVILVATFYIRKINGMEDDSDIENVLGQLHKRGFSAHRAPLDQSLEQLDNTEYRQLVENIARSPQVQIGYPYGEKDFNAIKNDRWNKHTQYRYWPWRQYIYVKPAWLKSLGPRKHSLYNKIQKNSKSSKYSKVYLVLDPNADITETDVRDLSKIISSVLAKPREPSVKDRLQTKRRYKGFLIKNDKRRRMRESKEMYLEKDSQEREYKPKRSRADHNSGGRTPIPYIRHRGDIFEKE